MKLTLTTEDLWKIMGACNVCAKEELRIYIPEKGYDIYIPVIYKRRAEYDYGCGLEIEVKR
jgi:hypothetical protein